MAIFRFRINLNKNELVEIQLEPDVISFDIWTLFTINMRVNGEVEMNRIYHTITINFYIKTGNGIFDGFSLSELCPS